MQNYAIILASGTGSRYGANIPKQFEKIGDKTILELSIENFEKSQFIDEIFVVITPEYRNSAQDILNKNSYNKVKKLLNGGKTRKESSYIGVNAIEKDEEANVLIHDCARPFVTQKIISDCIKALEKYNAVGVAIPTTDTIIETDNNDIITKIPKRENLKRIQTPQCFRLSIIKKAHELSKNDIEFTDDCGLIVKHNLCDIFIVDGDESNIKITYPSDIIIAEEIVKARLQMEK